MIDAEYQNVKAGTGYASSASSDADKWTIHTQEVNIDTLLIMLYEAYEPICRKNQFT
ncbi:MAG: hypothetical protein ACLVEU_02890 [Bacteroides cellulosilyticus]